MYDRIAKMFAAFAVIILLTGNLTVPMARGMGADYHTKDEIVYEYVTFKYEMAQTTSGARVIRENELVRQKLPQLSQKEYEILCRIVQAEAGGEDTMGKQMVADVIINRVKSARFPNSVSGVVFQGTQFSPIRDGRYYTVHVTQETRAAVNEALEGADSTGGALYFVNAQKADPANLAWFERKLTLCREHGGHRFYK